MSDNKKALETVLWAGADVLRSKMDAKDGRANIIKLVKNLKDDDRKFFIYEKLLEKCQFSKEDFFSNLENYQIQTLCLLNEELIKESQEEDKKKKKEDEKEEGKDKNNEIKLNILSQQGNKHAENLITILKKFAHKFSYYFNCIL